MIGRGAAGVWALFGAAAVGSSALVLARPAAERLSDLHIYYGAAEHVGAGQPLYEYVAANGGPFTYPPFAMVLLRPLTALPEGALQVLWLVLSCAAVAAIAASVKGAFGGRPVVVAAVACAVLVSAPAQSNLRFGQVSFFVVLLALVDAVGLTPARYRGVLVGVAAAVKLTPLLFVGYFLLAGRPRDAARAAAAFAACAVVGAVALPADSWAYWTGTVTQTSRVGNLAWMGNQSLHGMLLRAGVDPGTLPFVWATLVALVAGTAMWRARALWRGGEPVRAAVLVGCATVVASPVSWTHHQVWTVLAAMLLVATHGVAQRVAGAVLLVVMTVSLGAVLGDVSTYPGVQFLFENARAFGVAAVCLAGCGGVVAAAARIRSRRRAGLRVAVVGAAVLAGFAVLPLPAGADPTFKAYTMDDAANPRYFFASRAWAGGLVVRPEVPVRFDVAREKTKMRVNGVVGDAVARLEYRSAPGGSARAIPLLAVVAPGPREFSFRGANLTHGRLTAYAADGRELAAFTELTERSDP
ncbi:glycosyltransferase 87 family protein [Phytohabitans sp. LJ34]|uniref:glycosyltransferase 87 family protein n=1 Tax=Phytohabitans sp. LJ34 TaxID=3452217 RepID=UPI003F8994C0